VYRLGKDLGFSFWFDYRNAATDIYIYIVCSVCLSSSHNILNPVKQLNWSRCHLDGRLVCPQGTIYQMAVHVGATWQIWSNNPCLVIFTVGTGLFVFLIFSPPVLRANWFHGIFFAYICICMLQPVTASCCCVAGEKESPEERHSGGFLGTASFHLAF